MKADSTDQRQREVERMAAVRAIWRQTELARIGEVIAMLEALERHGVPLTHHERGQLQNLRKRRTVLTDGGS